MLEHEVDDGKATRQKGYGLLVITELASQLWTADLWTLFTWEKNKDLFY